MSEINGWALDDDNNCFFFRTYFLLLTLSISSCASKTVNHSLVANCFLILPVSEINRRAADMRSTISVERHCDKRVSNFRQPCRSLSGFVSCSLCSRKSWCLLEWRESYNWSNRKSEGAIIGNLPVGYYCTTNISINGKVSCSIKYGHEWQDCVVHHHFRWRYGIK